MKKRQAYWTPEEIRLLSLHHSSKTNAELSKMLGGRHSVGAIKMLAWRLRLAKTHEHKSLVGQANIARRWRSARSRSA